MPPFIATPMLIRAATPPPSLRRADPRYATVADVEPDAADARHVTPDTADAHSYYCPPRPDSLTAVIPRLRPAKIPDADVYADDMPPRRLLSRRAVRECAAE